MHSSRWFSKHLLALALTGLAVQAMAGQTPGVASPWNGPWGGGFLNGESYGPLANPYVGAGYPVASPLSNGRVPARGNYSTMPGGTTPYQGRPLPGGGFLLPPGAGGGMLTGAYANH